MGSKPSAVPIRNLVLVLVLIAVLRLVFGLGPVEELLHRSMAPINNAVESISYSDNQNSNSSQNSSRVAQLEAQNEQLKQQLDISDDQVAARVIKKDVTGIRKLIVIDKGGNDSIASGDPVLSNGELIGIVKRVNASTSVVQLMVDPEFRVTAITEEGEGGVIKTENGSLIFDLAANSELSTKYISTDGIDGIFPPGIAIGPLGDRISSEDSTFHRYHIILPSSVDEITNVTVVSG